MTPPRFDVTAHRLLDNVQSADQLDGIAAPVAKLVGRATQSTAIKNALSGTWLGHQLHPLLTDLTIGAWIGVPVVDALGGAESARTARLLTGLGILSAVPTAASGLSDWSDTYGPDMRVGLVHALGNVTGVALQVSSYIARRRGRRGRGAALSVAGLSAAAAAAYLGGHLVYSLGVGVNHTAFEHRPEDWTDVGSAVALTESSPLRVEAHGIPVVVVKRGERLFALSATCAHAGGPLAEGELIDGCLRCPWHGSTFRLDDGRVVRGPAAVNQPVWDVRIHEASLQVRARRSPSE
ncbi:MAG TPA: Rieske (2Fe-2S) protein [Solirubrobacteraceae bacterium]|jgi:nitrite reductase/ring-hydroxylating ferredoxin subunit|nr:Rieske (2Fe-2S) protein [Solirubrobacteraceae bacterium]